MGGEPFEELVAQSADPVPQRGVIDPVDAFVRVADQVEQFVRSIRVAVDVFPLPGADHSDRAIFVVNDNAFRRRKRSTRQNRREAATRLRPFRRFIQARVFQQGREYVISAQQIVTDQSCGNPPRL